MQFQDRCWFGSPSARMNLAIATLVVIVGVTGAPRAWAQNAPGSQGTNTELQEVVVTAERKRENLQDVPLSVQAIDEKELTERGARDLHDVLIMSPGVDFSSVQPGNAVLAVRGIYPLGGGATTALYLDDVPITGFISGGYSNSPEPLINDTARVEVLKGPQGTLYGDTAMGGAVKFITNLPDASGFSGHANVEAATTEDAAGSRAANATLNIPLLTNVLALRTSVSFRDDGGYLDNVSPYTHQVDGLNVNTYQAEAARVALGFTPDDTWSIVGAFTYQDYHTGDRPYESVPGSELLPGAGPQPPFWTTTGLQPFQMTIASSEPTSDHFDLTTLTIDKKFSFANLTSISSWYMRTDDVTTDPTAFIDGIVTGPPLVVQNAFFPAVTNSYADESEDDLTEEVRLASNREASRLDWTVGAFARRQHTFSTQTIITHGLTANLVQEVGPGTTLADYFPGALPNDTIFMNHQSVYVNDLAAFGELGFKVTEALKLTAGVRVYQISQKYLASGDGWLSGGPFANGFPTETFRGNTPRYVLDYKITPENFVYASASEGFRQGEVNSPVPVPLCSQDLAALGLTQVPAGVNSDSLWNYEIGSKNEMLGGRLRVNGAVYEEFWSNIQLTIGLPHCQYSFNDNVGTARVRGAEFSVDTQLVQNTTVGVDFNYIDAVITEVLPNAQFQVGDKLPYAPKYMANGYIQYSHLLTDSIDGYIRADYMKRGAGVRGASVTSDLPGYIENGWDEADLTVGANWKQWNARLFVRNALNREAIIDETNYWGQYRTAPQYPRVVGLNVGITF